MVTEMNVVILKTYSDPIVYRTSSRITIYRKHSSM